MGYETKVNVCIEFFSEKCPLDETRLEAVKEILKEFEINPQGVNHQDGELWFDYYCRNQPDYEFLDKIRDSVSLGATRISSTEWTASDEGYYYDIEDEEDENT